MTNELSSLGITLVGDWSNTLMANLNEALFTYIGPEALGRWLNGQALTFRSGGRAALEPGTYYGLTSGDTITLYANRNANPVINILHEIGHAVDNLWSDFFTRSLKHRVFTQGGEFLAGWDGFEYRRLPGTVIRSEALLAPRAGGGDAWQQRGGRAHWEDWADIFSNAMIGNLDACSEIGAQLGAFVRSMQGHVFCTAAV